MRSPSAGPLICVHDDRAWRLHVCFAGKLPPHDYWSPDVRRANPGWGDNHMNRQIERIEFYLPTRPCNCILLSGMEAYNFFIEATESFARRGPRIEAFWVMGRIPGQVTVESWRVGNGKVLREHHVWGREWCGAATRGWKPGLIGPLPVSSLMEA